MTRREKADRIHRILDQLHPDVPVPLVHHDPFTLLIAVLLSAQTTDARVNLVTPALFARADTPQQMAALSVAEVLEFVRTCGLAPGKSKNIQRLSEILVSEHLGRVPQDIDALEALPGVGHKTASVVMAQAFGVPAFPVDTHIHRLAARWGLSDGSNVVKTERDLKALFPEGAWNRLHLQIIYFGRTHCPALRHDLSACPICGWAAAKKRVAAEAAQATRKRPAKTPATRSRPATKPRLRT
ncbi:MAG: endonuclease III [Nannocystaceae bacterium]